MRRTSRQAISAFLLSLAPACACAPAAQPRAAPATPPEVPGVTAGEIRLGTHTPLTGPLALYGDITRAGRAYFEEVNAAGGVHGRRISLLVEDDAYDPARTAPAVRRLIEDQRVFAIFQGIGTPTHATVVDALTREGVPDLFLASGAEQFFRPLRPNLFVMNVPYRILGRALGAWAARCHPGRRIGISRQGSAYGAELMAGVRDGLGDRAAAALDLENRVDTDLDEHARRFEAAGVEVAVLIAGPPQIAPALASAGARGYRPVWLAPLLDGLIDGAGPAAEGLVGAHWLRMPENADEPGIAAHRALLRRRAPGVLPTGTSVGGQVAAELTVEALRRAGPALTRASLLRAVESIRGFRCSLCLVPAEMSEVDHVPFEDVMMMQVRGGRWAYLGDEGAAPRCEAAARR